MQTSEGYVFFFGKNSHGQIGIKLFDDNALVYDQDNFTATPTLFDTCLDATQVSTGVLHSAVMTRSKLYTFGSGSFGKLGIGNTEDYKIPQQITIPGVVIMVACANEHTLALVDSGRVFSWGSGSKGRLGHSNTQSLLSPRTITTLHVDPIEKIYANGASSAAISKRGNLYTWGYNKYGQLGIGNTNEEITTPTVVSFFNSTTVKIQSLSIGDRHMGAIDHEGSIYMWGSNSENQLSIEGGDRSSPTQNLKFRVRFKSVECGGTFTAAISDEGDDNSLYIWGTFYDYCGVMPKKYGTNIESVSCSHDCSKNLLAIKQNGELWTGGWSRYGQAGGVTEVVTFSRMESIIARATSVHCGGYHSAILFKNPFDSVFQLFWLNHIDLAQGLAIDCGQDILKHTNFNGDNILHIIAKKGFTEQMNIPKLGILINKLNNDGRPPFFYNGILLSWYISNMPDIFFRDKEGQTCLHYYCKNNLLEYITYILAFSAFDERIRDKEMKRAFDYLPKSTAFDIKKRFKISDVGIVYHSENVKLAEKIKKSVEENHYTCELISTESNAKKRCIGYIFLVSNSSLNYQFTRDLLVNTLVKAPMISIWAEKVSIKDPTLESCIYRSQLVDFSSSALYNDALSILIEGIDNLMDFVVKDKEDETETDLKTDTEFVKISGEESIYISFDQSKQNNYKELFKFLENNDIKIISKEQGLLTSWVLVVIINSKEFTPQIRDEISLAENRNKPVLPIYYEQSTLDQGSVYTFANSPKLSFDEEGFYQLLTLIKLNYKYLNNSSKLFNLMNQ